MDSQIIFWNQSQLARQLNKPDRTVRLRVQSGELKPSAFDSLGRPLFDSKLLPVYQSIFNPIHVPSPVMA